MMKPTDLVLRCYAEKKDGQWQAFCVDLCLAAQGDSFDEVRRKLESQVKEYVFDALAGPDRSFGDVLLSRKAPLMYRLKFRFLQAVFAIGLLKDGVRRLFSQTLPLEPQTRGPATC